MADLQWEQFTLGQNKTITEIATAAGKAAALVDANAKFAQTTLGAAKVLLMGLLNPQLLLLVAIADEIDNVIADFKGTGFYVIEIRPTGKEIIPTDVKGNAIALAVSPIALTAAYATAQAANMGKQWLQWFEIVSGEKVQPVKVGEDIKLEKSSYYIEQGKGKAEEVRDQGANDDKVADKDKIFGFPKMTPSQIIAQIISAMDDETDANRPTFSSSAQVAAIVVIIGFADISKNILPLSNALQAFIAFFGGENGLMNKGLVKTNKIVIEGMKAALQIDENGDPLTNPVDTVTINVTDVCGVRGTDDDKKIINLMGVDYNYEAGFEVGNLVVGPVRIFGGTAGKGRAMGIVSKVTTTPNTPKEPYSSQELVLTTLTPLDKHAFEHLSKGNKIQKVVYVQSQNSHIDQNTGEFIVGPVFNDYEYIQDAISEADMWAEDVEPKIRTKVRKVPGKALLQPLGDKENAIEKHSVNIQGQQAREGVSGEQYTKTTTTYLAKTWYGKIYQEGIPANYQTKNEVIGLIDKVLPDIPAGVPPNFKKAKLEDLMGDLQTFFFQIQQFTDGLRRFAEGAGDALKDLLKYLDEKIAEIEELNKTIQDILELFTIGIPDSGVYVLSIPTTEGGNDAIKEALASASNRPPNSLEMSVGFMMMGGGPSMKVLVPLLTGG